MEFINNEEYNRDYIKIKEFIDGTINYDDAVSLYNMIEMTDSQKNLYMNILKNKKYSQTLDMSTLISTIELINNLEYREDAYERINEILKQTTDINQIKTLTRVANTKPLRPVLISLGKIREV